jgi:hypothetical protein
MVKINKLIFFFVTTNNVGSALLIKIQLRDISVITLNYETKIKLRD